MPRSVHELLDDVLRYAAAVSRMIEGKTALTYANDERLRYASERCLIVVGEALAQVLRLRPDLLFDIADARRAIGLRNRLVHEYDSVSDLVIWLVLHDFLPAMRLQIEVLLAEEQEVDDVE